MIIVEDDVSIMPIPFKKWTKRKLIELFNNRANRNTGSIYTLKNLDSKRFSEIFRELASLLAQEIDN